MWEGAKVTNIDILHINDDLLPPNNPWTPALNVTLAQIFTSFYQRSVRCCAVLWRGAVTQISPLPLNPPLGHSYASSRGYSSLTPQEIGYTGLIRLFFSVVLAYIFESFS